MQKQAKSTQKWDQVWKASFLLFPLIIVHTVSIPEEACGDVMHDDSRFAGTRIAHHLRRLHGIHIQVGKRLRLRRIPQQMCRPFPRRTHNDVARLHSFLTLRRFQNAFAAYDIEKFCACRVIMIGVVGLSGRYLIKRRIAVSNSARLVISCFRYS